MRLAFTLRRYQYRVLCLFFPTIIFRVISRSVHGSWFGPRVRSGGNKKLAGQVASGPEVFESHGLARIGSGRSFKYHGSGRVNNLIRFDPIREEKGFDPRKALKNPPFVTVRIGEQYIFGWITCCEQHAQHLQISMGGRVPKNV